MDETKRKSAIEVLAATSQTSLVNPGVTSVQLLWPGNSPSAQVTVTRVTVAPGAGQPRHAHAASEQIWIVEQGAADMLLAGDRVRRIGAGEVVRTPAGEIHGLHNDTGEPFVYLAITTPPVDFRPAYRTAR